ncbi:MAG TPA: PDZ domain-containing protein [Saprospiraceae bacterium]|nr:PDZ domain-containing protein [Saprospiraceae bacterium]
MKIIWTLMILVSGFQRSWASPERLISTQSPSAKIIRIPFRYVQSFIILDVKLAHVLPIQLIFDTGSEHTILFEKKWTDLIVNSYLREIKVIGSDLRDEIPALVTAPLELRFGNEYQLQSNLIVLKENTTMITQIIGEPVHGILSASAFSGYRIEIDYRRQQILLHPSNARIPSSFKTVDLMVQKNKPYLKMMVKHRDGEAKAMNLLLDTGAGLSALLYLDSLQMRSLPKGLLPGFLGNGLGGILTGYVGKLQSIRLDTFLILNPITHFLRIETVIGKNESQVKNGLIGNHILERFNLIFDYRQEKLYIKARKDYRKPESFDKSGMLIIAGGPDLHDYFIAQVIPGTPADLAGLQEQDEIISINGVPADFYSLSAVQAKLHRKEGKKIRMKIRRNGEKRAYVFYLKTLI